MAANAQQWTIFLARILLLQMLLQIMEIYGDCRSLDFRTIMTDKYLANHTIPTIQPISDSRTCRFQCFLESRCFGFNFCVDQDSTAVCELTDSDHVRSGKDLINKPGCTFYGSENVCSSSPCANNATCQPNYTRDARLSYRCICPAGYTGQMCETDMNECTSGTHGCSEFANCTNLPGGHNCTCKNGFHGDGKVCHEINECTSDSHGCHVNATCTNTIGGHTCSCHQGLFGDGSLLCRYPRTCEEAIVASSATATIFHLLEENADLIYKFCPIGENLGCGDGPWTLVMKIDGTNTTFQYASQLWRNEIPYNKEVLYSGLQKIETKQPAFWSKPMTKLCLGMMYEGVTNWISTSLNANSLSSAISGKASLTFGRDKWISLLQPIAVKDYCNREGIDEPNCKGSRSMLSFWTNGKNHCSDCDAYIGFGSTGPACGDRNVDNGENRPAFCYILIQ